MLKNCRKTSNSKVQSNESVFNYLIIDHIDPNLRKIKELRKIKRDKKCENMRVSDTFNEENTYRQTDRQTDS